jgi:hypothetical protein
MSGINIPLSSGNSDSNTAMPVIRRARSNAEEMAGQAGFRLFILLQT